jgi:hypothetical protein
VGDGRKDEVGKDRPFYVATRLEGKYNGEKVRRACRDAP